MKNQTLSYRVDYGEKELKKKISKLLVDFNKNKPNSDKLYLADSDGVKIYIGERQNGGYVYNANVNERENGFLLTGEIIYKTESDKKTKWYKYIPVILLGIILSPFLLVYLLVKFLGFLVKKIKKIPVSNEEILDDFMVKHVKAEKI
jgi:hypothetical protein